MIKLQICRSNYQWSTLVSLTLFAVVFVGSISYASNRFSLLSLPSSPWPWRWTTSSSSSLNFSIPSINLHHPPPSPPPPLINPKTALYSMFHCDSDACKKQNGKMNKVVSKLMKELKDETLFRMKKKNKMKRDKKLEKVEAELGRARVLISDAGESNHSRSSDPDYVPRGSIYRNPSMFHSVAMILDNLFDPIIRDKAVLGRVIGDYVHTVSSRYPYWNRSLGSDHFMLSCHDWGPRATWYVHSLYFTSIRLLCNANTSEFFNPRKDASIPEISLHIGETTTITGGLPASNRTTLAFFAGGQFHGKIRPLLFQHWKDKDQDIQLYDRVPKNVSYHEMMKTSRFCLCPSGFEVASPRITEAIYAECVPVLISQHYVLPFSDVLNWDAFSVRVLVSEIPNLKKILLGISDDKYTRLQENVKMVQRHFLVNNPAKRYDVYHMILHSLWLRRLNLQIYG
ncbi:Exostosin-like protein [Cynara cardunculus var. scolymus]|uniref:Exostosin-like protein n=1 Tax=Cynara cardunculus var. scolymus TaxID=59895 RepID=A0A103Y404_CYNCS|nr:Exostosin-like protein [Cynara cardunculus var. scolymus]